MDRLVAAGNSGLKGVLDGGSVAADDPTTVEFTLVGANGNFPYLVSIYNAQTVITPADYAAGTTLDQRRRNRRLEARQLQPGRRARRSSATPTWWGGTTPLDAVEFRSSTARPDDHRLPGRPGRAIVQFDVNSARPCSTTRTSGLIAAPTAHHRQIWMRTDTGAFTDKRVRQALALSLDRKRSSSSCSRAGPDRQRPRHLPPATRTSTRPCRSGPTTSKGQAAPGRRRRHRPHGDLHAADSRRSRTSPCSSRARPSRPASAEPRRSRARHVLRRAVVPGRAGGPALLRRRGARHRRLRPSRRRRTSTSTRRSRRRASGTRRSTRPRSTPRSPNSRRPSASTPRRPPHQDRDDPQRRRPGRDPVLYNYLAGNSKKFTGVFSSALGQMFFSTASKVG